MMGGRHALALLGAALVVLVPVTTPAQQIVSFFCTTAGGTGCTNPIPAAGTSGAMAPSTITIPANACLRILDVNVGIAALHTFRADLEVSITAPGGAPIELFSDVGGSGDNFSLFLDSDAGANIAATCVDATPPPCNTTSTPETANALDALDGPSAAGVWTLSVNDDAGGDVGALQEWALSFTCPPNADGDGVEDALDNCPNVSNTDQADVDGDAVGDACDNCPAVTNADQADADSDGIGDACDQHVTPVSILDCTSFGTGCTNLIPAGAPGATQGSMTPAAIVVPPGSCFRLLDVDVLFRAMHTYRSDLEVTLTPPGGAPLELFSGVGGSGNDFDVVLDPTPPTASPRRHRHPDALQRNGRA
jgi:subtilisin-like proprotein convertase family protein